MKVINLRAKLRTIEAKRADRSNVCKLNTCLARLKYPKTDSGRRRFIQDSLKPDNKRRGKFCLCLAILIGIAGMVVSFVICLHDKGSFLLAILSMALLALGIHGLKERREVIQKYGFWFPIVRIYSTEKWIVRILITLAFTLMLLIPVFCSSCATLHKSYCQKKQDQHVNSIYKSYWLINPVKHIPKK